MKEALDKLDAQGISMDYLRLRGFPFTQEVQKFIDTHERVFVVEQNRDAQLKSLLALELNVAKRKLIPVLHYKSSTHSVHRHTRRNKWDPRRGLSSMSYITKPKVKYAGLKKNKLGLTIRDYQGGMSTLCAGCGHDSITAALVQAFFELKIPPEEEIEGVKGLVPRGAFRSPRYACPIRCSLPAFA